MVAPIEVLLNKHFEELSRVEPLKNINIPEREIIVDRAHLSFHDIGLSLILPDCETVGEIQLHSQGHEGFKGFPWPMPAGVTFDMSRADVRALLGKPEQSGEAGHVFPFGLMPSWDSFLTRSLRIHVEYNLNGICNRLVSLSRPTVFPRATPRTLRPLTFCSFYVLLRRCPTRRLQCRRSIRCRSVPGRMGGRRRCSAPFWSPSPRRGA